MKLARTLAWIAMGFPLAATAAPINYLITFTGLAPVPTSASFTYDPTAGFAAFTVVFGSIPFDLTAAANSPQLNGPSNGCSPRAAIPQYSFLILSQAVSGCAQPPTYLWQGFVSPPLTSFEFLLTDTATFGNVQSDMILRTGPGAGVVLSNAGNWSIQPAAQAPEPATYMVVLLGLLTFLGMRKTRNSQ